MTLKKGNICTIYLLTNKVNNKIYVGQTWGTCQDRMGKDGSFYKNSIYLYNAINKYGADNFEYKHLAYCEKQEDADLMEEYYINLYNSKDHDIGYNIKGGGSVGKHSSETIEKMSKTQKEIASKWTPEELAKRVAPVINYWNGKKRGPHTEEWKEENSERMIEWHKNNNHPMKGKHHTEESKALISEAGKGRKPSDETKKKISEAKMMDAEREQKIIDAYVRGDKISQIVKELEVKTSSLYRIVKRNNLGLRDQSINKIGVAASEETKNKMSESRKKYWDEKKENKLED